MKSPKILAALSVVAILLFSFNRLKSDAQLNIDDIKVIDLLSEQELGCRPSHNYMFYVKTSIENQDSNPVVRAKVYIVDRKTNQTSVVAQENITLNEFDNIAKMSSNNRKDLKNIKSLSDSPYNFYELIQFEPIYRNFVDSTNRLL